MRLENWSIVTDASPYTAPELCVPRVRGNVYDNPRFDDGEIIVTSELKAFKGKNTIITNSGSHYELGKVDEEYEKIFPDALNRLKTSYKNSRKK